MNSMDLEYIIEQRGTLVASKDQVSNDLNGETIILNLKTSEYYGMDGTGARIWNLLQTPRTITEIRDALLEAYDIEPERCERDLLSLLRELADVGLIETNDETDT